MRAQVANNTIEGKRPRAEMRSFSRCEFADATPRAPVRDATRTRLESSPRKSRASVRCCGSTKANPRKHVYVLGLQGGKESENESRGMRKSTLKSLARNLRVCTFREALRKECIRKESLRSSFQECGALNLPDWSNESLLPTWGNHWF